MDNIACIGIVIRGAVQGVGFRPFVYRLARELGLNGWVSNSTDGVHIEAEGAKDSIDEFLLRLNAEHPDHASIQSLEYSILDARGFTDFRILRSESSGKRLALILPDIATCRDCLLEIFDPSDRRYLYPFTNCTNCGPRFTIIESLPYDRANTTMSRFVMCLRCRSEFENPLDRRFHAQPNACPDCGPQVEAWDASGVPIVGGYAAIGLAVNALRRGLIVAVKGVGGFHLLADATNEDAVLRLRARKGREKKPFALMAPSRESVRDMCLLNALEERILTAPEAPIVILSRKDRAGIAPSVAPNNPYLGVMLPGTPLHHILMHEVQSPVVATSGNRSEEPIAIHELDAIRRLSGIADLFLVHNRPIRRHADDSIVRILLGREQVLRRARGYAPLPVPIRNSGAGPALAVGGHLKNTVALTIEGQAFVSQHIGDLETSEAFHAFSRVIDDFRTLYDSHPRLIIADMHPDFSSTAYARRIAESCKVPLEHVQHHCAHILSCMAENQVDPPALGVAWDGAGYGPDGTVWGGEFLLATDQGFRRVAHLRTFPLPGGDAAVRKPRQTAAGVLYEIDGAKGFNGNEPALLRQMLEKRLRSPRTSSAGRLFDAVASMVGICDQISFEGQAAMELEFAAASNVDSCYEYVIRGAEPIMIDWEPMIRQITAEVRNQVDRSLISARFHNTLAVIIVDIARRIKEPRVVLSGGCFQNRYLAERTVLKLSEAGFTTYWHQRVPPNDGGLALGQAMAAQAAFLSSRSAPPQEERCVSRSPAK